MPIYNFRFGLNRQSLLATLANLLRFDTPLHSIDQVVYLMGVLTIWALTLTILAIQDLLRFSWGSALAYVYF